MKVFHRKLTLFVMCSTLLIAGCGSSNTTVTTSLLSDEVLDGDIEGISSQSPSTYIVTQGMSSSVQSVFAGIADSATGDEFRAFLDFHLDGPDGIPGKASIDDATLDLFIYSLNIDANIKSVPVQIDLVSFDQTTLLNTDFDRTIQPALTSITINPGIAPNDVGNFVSLDVTSLLREAQNRGLADFQIRILEDLNYTTLGLIEIDDRTGSDRRQYAPYLTVTYH